MEDRTTSLSNFLTTLASSVSPLSFEPSSSQSSPNLSNSSSKLYDQHLARNGESIDDKSLAYSDGHAHNNLHQTHDFPDYDLLNILETHHDALYPGDNNITRPGDFSHYELFYEFNQRSIPYEQSSSMVTSWESCFRLFSLKRQDDQAHDPTGCQIKFDGVSCWPETPAGTLATISCFEEFNGLFYDTTREYNYCMF